MHSGVLVNSSNPRSNIYVCSAHMKIKYFTTNRAALTSLSVKASSARSLCAWVSIVVKIKLESLLRNVANSREREAERGDETCLWKLKQINWLKHPRTSQNSLRSLATTSHSKATKKLRLLCSCPLSRDFSISFSYLETTFHLLYLNLSVIVRASSDEIVASSEPVFLLRRGLSSWSKREFGLFSVGRSRYSTKTRTFLLVKVTADRGSIEHKSGIL